MTTEQQSRTATITRATAETEISLTLGIDGAGEASVSTGVGFLDHMLTLLSVHGSFDLMVSASGDTMVDDHHSVEDVGICLGRALAQVLGDKSGIRRYGMSYVPMDEALARAVVDISNRPYVHYRIGPLDQKIGTFDTSLVKEFMRALAVHGGLTLHLDLLHGENSHHIIEAVFKALGRALREATTRRERTAAALSSKGSL